MPKTLRQWHRRYQKFNTHKKRAERKEIFAQHRMVNTHTHTHISYNTREHGLGLHFIPPNSLYTYIPIYSKVPLQFPPSSSSDFCSCCFMSRLSSLTFHKSLQIEKNGARCRNNKYPVCKFFKSLLFLLLLLYFVLSLCVYWLLAQSSACVCVCVCAYWDLKDNKLMTSPLWKNVV